MADEVCEVRARVRVGVGVPYRREGVLGHNRTAYFSVLWVVIQASWYEYSRRPPQDLASGRGDIHTNAIGSHLYALETSCSSGAGSIAKIRSNMRSLRHKIILVWTLDPGNKQTSIRVTSDVTHPSMNILHVLYTNHARRHDASEWKPALPFDPTHGTHQSIAPARWSLRASASISAGSCARGGSGPARRRCTQRTSRCEGTASSE